MDGLSIPFKLSHFIDLIFLFVRYICLGLFIFLLLFCKCLTPSRVADYDKLNYDKVTNYL